jgi:hypothetical protein
MPASWLFLERLKWALMPQIQPMRALLFAALMAQFLAAAAAFLSRTRLEAFAWLAFAFLLSLQPVITDSLSVRHMAVAFALAALCVAGRRSAPRALSPVAAAAAFFAIPILGGVVDYPRLHTPEIAQLSDWARSSTSKDAVFLFPAAGHALDPGIFRAEALRAVYVDWKGGGQVNYIQEFAIEWWFRWQQTMVQTTAQPVNFPKYDALGIRYVVLKTQQRLAQPAVYENAKYIVYAVR